jgi:hypothetical protein
MLLILCRRFKYRWQSSSYLKRFFYGEPILLSFPLSGKMYIVQNRCSRLVSDLKSVSQPDIMQILGYKIASLPNTLGQKRSSAHLHPLQFFLSGIFKYIFSVLYSTLLHLPPLRFHCVGRCCDRNQDSCDYAIGCQPSYVNM